MSLRDTVSLVTGGGRGIGRAIALGLASAGSSVAVVARSEDELGETVSRIESAGGHAVAWTADVTDAARVEVVVEEITSTLGPITLLVNNAGAAGAAGPLWMTDPDDWWRGVDVNVRGPYLFSRFVLPGMIERGAGRIVNVSSNVAIRPTPMATSYASAKAALLRLTDSLAGEVAHLGVQVFAISPGWVWTAMTERAVEVMKAHMPGFTGIPDSETSPPEDAANLVVRLARGDADALSGRYIHVNDDLDDLIANADEIVSRDVHALRFQAWGPG